MKKIFFLFLIALLFFLIYACRKDKSPLQSEPDYQWVVDTTLIHEMMAHVDTGRIWQNLVNLSSFPDRSNFGETIDEARAWLSENILSIGLNYDVYRYFGTPLKFYFSSALNGLAYAIPDIGMQTGNGGLNWIKISLPYNPEFYFIDEITGYLSSENRNLFKSTDNGSTTWTELNSNIGLRALYFINKNDGWGLSGDQLYYTKDGGYFWNEKSNFFGAKIDLFFWDSSSAIISSEDKMFKTSDSWNSWTEILNAPTGYDIFFLNNNIGFMKSLNHTYYYTNDGGISWAENHSVNTNSITDLVFIKPDHLWGLADEKIWYSSDRGENWVLRNTFKGKDASLFFGDSLNGWLYSTRGIFKTTDGGYTWSDQIENIPENITWENIIVTIPGKTQPDEQVLVIAHYDTYGTTPGADDNASGVSALLEYLNIVSGYDFAKTIKFVFFSGEELGLIGSKRYVELAGDRGDHISAVLNFDVIGYWEEGLPRDLNLIRDANSAALADTLIYAINSFTHTTVTKNEPTGESDHESFWNNGYPAVWFSEGSNDQDFNPYMNSSEDAIEHLNKQFLFDNIHSGLAAVAYLAKPVKQLSKKE